MKADDTFKSKGPELLVDLSVQIAQALVELASIDTDQAEQIGREIADRMAGHWGGQNIYFPMGVSYRLSQRDRQIFEEFRGDNQAELARKFGVSLQWVYKIIKTVRREDIAARQRDLFGGPATAE
ncbi:Mor transcription activator family protein [Burkholderia glumae]|uniref:Mor transcription activator family protein n=1 Tax=Burkholderia glumae TaxID=337 RepID=UPI0005C2962A|nr:Mor transcription activator family protein [Burkholderia glumae]MCM2494578.1 DNA-binding protein [Burkholderia glumae]